MSEPRAGSNSDEQPSDVQARDEPFERTLARLEKTLERLEKSELPLEDALTAYEDGLRLVKAAQAKLDSMDARLEQLLASGATAPLGPASDDKKSK